MPKLKTDARHWKNFETVLCHARIQAKLLRVQLDDLHTWSRSPACTLHKEALEFAEQSMRTIESDIYLLADCSRKYQREMLVRIIQSMSSTCMRIDLLWIAGNPLLSEESEKQRGK